MASPLRPFVADRRGPAPLVVVASAVEGLRRRCCQALDGLFGLHEVADRAALERSVANRKAAVLLLDLDLPGLGGVEGVPAIHRLRPATKIVLFGVPDEREAIIALKAGARGHCDKAIDPALLRKAVEVVHKGEIWVARRLIPHFLDELTSLTERRLRASRAHFENRFERLTPRERELVDFLSEGASNKDIAKRLNVTERTVKAHLTAIFRKLGLVGRLQLALYAIEHGQGTGAQ